MRRWLSNKLGLGTLTCTLVITRALVALQHSLKICISQSHMAFEVSSGSNHAVDKLVQLFQEIGNFTVILTIQISAPTLQAEDCYRKK